MNAAREIAQDPAAEAEARSNRAERKEKRKAAARARAAKAYERKKASRKASGAQTSTPGSTPATEAVPQAVPSVEAESPLLQEAAGKTDDARARELSPEEKAALALINTPAGFAQFLANQHRFASRMAAAGKRSSPRVGRVVAALGWADDNGKATEDCVQGVSIAWPWLEAEGFALLAQIGPRLMAVMGAAILFGPAIVVAVDELQEHRLEREAVRAARQAASPPILRPTDAHAAQGVN